MGCNERRAALAEGDAMSIFDIEFMRDNANFGTFFRGRVPDNVGMPDAFLREVIRKVAERYVSENYDAIATKIDPQTVAIAVQTELVDRAVAAVQRAMLEGLQ